MTVLQLNSEDLMQILILTSVIMKKIWSRLVEVPFQLRVRLLINLIVCDWHVDEEL